MPIEPSKSPGGIAGDPNYAPGGDSGQRLENLARWALGALVLVAILAMRYKLAAYRSPDFNHFLIHWYRHLESAGAAGLKETFSDYNMPYLYLLWIGTKLHLGALVTVKALANAFDVLLAFAVFRLVEQFVGRTPALVAAVSVMLLPSVWFNSAVWGQADSMYTAFCLLALDAWLRGKQSWSWLLAGVAFSLKLQSIFFLPWLAVAWVLHRQRKWTALPWFLVAPGLAMIPALLLGKPLGELLRVYLDQTHHKPFSHSPSFWRLVVGGRVQAGIIWDGAVFFAAAGLFLFAWLLMRHHAWDIDRRRMISSAAVISLLLPFLLPNMRNRYFFVGQILVLVGAFIYRKWVLCVVLELIMAPTYARQLLGVPAPLPESLWVLGMAVVIALLVQESLKRPVLP